MIKRTAFCLLFIFTVFFTFTLDLVIPKSVEQGGVLTVVTDSSGVKLSFGSDDEIHSRTESFKTDIDGQQVYIALLGVPSTLAPGTYAVNAFGSPDDGEESRTEAIIVKSRDFINEDIPLGNSMSELRQSDDARKAEQWRTLLEILKNVDSTHVYESEKLAVPVTDYIRTSSFYGDRRRFLYDDGTSARSIHNGIDYSAEPGTPVYAAGSGRVVFSGERIISGNTIVIEHLPGVYSLYYHMNSLKAGEGSFVEAGTQIGTVGATGLVTGAHLHWEIRVAGVAVDPGQLTGGGIIDKAFVLSNIGKQ